MGWTGIMLGALLGFGLTRSTWGAVIGAIIAYMVQSSRAAPSRSADPQALRAGFFQSAFEVMGHAAKADGRVSESEIEAARALMRELALDNAEAAAAMRHFNAGKEAGFDPQVSADRLLAVCGNRYDLLRHFIALQLRAALLGNGISPPTRAKLMRFSELLGFSGLEFAYMEVSLRAQYQAREQGYAGSAPNTPPRSSLAEFYAELEVSEKVTDQEVVKAYRRQMSRHHPDKLVANGLPESMMQWAKEKTQRIQEAYEGIRASRGMR